MLNTPLHISDDLLVKYMLGEALPHEQLQVHEWLQANEANEKYFRHFTTIWNESKTLAATITVDEKEAWKKFKSRIEKNAAETKKRKPATLLFKRQLQVAAAVLLIAVAGWLVYNAASNSEALMVNKQTFASTLIDTLTDGSIITLNKNTKLDYPSAFTGKTRTVQLKGEAFFKVAHDKAKPFIVNANDITITVVGTEFNVKNYDSSTQVIVESGIVRVSKGSNSIELHKGEQVMIKNNNASFEKSVIKDSLYNYYRTKEIICSNTPLPAVIATINEAYNAHIVLGSEALNQLQLSATFKDEDLQTIITIIQQTFDLQVTRQGDSTILNLK